jgi:hypothetical protein
VTRLPWPERGNTRLDAWISQTAGLSHRSLNKQSKSSSDRHRSRRRRERRPAPNPPRSSHRASQIPRFTHQIAHRASGAKIRRKPPSRVSDPARNLKHNSSTDRLRTGAAVDGKQYYATTARRRPRRGEAYLVGVEEGGHASRGVGEQTLARLVVGPPVSRGVV